MDAKLSITTSCGARCATCPAWKRPAHTMGAEDFCTVWMKLNDSPDVSRILINGTGDITSVPQGKEYLEAAADYKKKFVTMTTNGAHLDSIPRVLDEIIISFNGGTEEGYRSTTGLSFHKVAAKIRKLYPEIAKLQNAEMHCLIWKENQGEEEAFRSYWADFPGRLRISYKAENQGGEYFGIMEAEEPRVPCDYLWQLIIEWDGRVSACCHDWEGVTSFGNIITDPVDSVIHSQERARMIQDHKNGKFLGPCEKCNYNTAVIGKVLYV